MSLKAFHIFFIVVSAVMLIGVGGWAIGQYRITSESAYLILLAVAAGAGIGLLVYGRWFLRKIQRAGWP